MFIRIKPIKKNFFPLIFFNILLIIIVIEILIILALKLNIYNNVITAIKPKKIENCLNLSREKINKLKNDINEWNNYLYFCQILNKSLENNDNPNLILGPLSYILSSNIYNYDATVNIKLKAKIIDIYLDGYVYPDKNTKIHADFVLVLEDENRNKRILYSNKDFLNYLKIYKSKNNIKKEITLKDLKIGNLIEFLLIYRLPKFNFQNFSLEKAEILLLR